MGLEDPELGTKRWSVIISIHEHGGRTEAKAHLFWPHSGVVGVGRAPLDPADETLDKLAAARALSDLATQLSAVSDIEAAGVPRAR